MATGQVRQLVGTRLMGERENQQPVRTWRRIAGLPRVLCRLDPPAHPRQRRAVLLAGALVLLFAVSGVVRILSPMQLLAESPFDLDYALRTLSAGWFQPRHVLPVTLVEIDEATHKSWGSPAITPRVPLTELIDKITQAVPAAVIVDIDLAWSGDEAGQDVLQAFLENYPGPAPLLFPKRLDPAPGGTRSAAVSRFDDVFASNPQLAWVHASFESESGGVVRQWADWVEVCGTDGTHLLASAPARLSLLLDPLPVGLTRSTPPSLSGACSRDADSAGQLLLIGPRLTGPARAGMTADAASVPALSILDPDMERDDGWLFGGRVVIIGATHPASGDFWLTPSGVLPGAELIANTVRYATLRSAPGWRAILAQRVAVLTAFLMFVLIGWWLRGLAAAAAYVLSGLAFIAIPIWLWDYFRVFEALEIAILLTLVYRFAEALFDLILEWKAQRAQQTSGFRGSLRTLWAIFRKPISGD